jgi:hypothetical protein
MFVPVSFRSEALSKAFPRKVEFQPAFASISIEIDRGLARTWGRNAGAEGLGCLFELDEDQVLRALELELAPYEVVDVAPMQMLEPIRTAIHAHARPGLVRMEHIPATPINPDAVWLLAPFGSALFSFDRIVCAPAERFDAARREMELVQIAEGVTLGLARDTGTLRLVFLEDFAWHQRLIDLQVSAEHFGEDFMRALNTIHSLYYEDPDETVFASRVEEILARLSPPELLPRDEWEKALRAVRRIAEIYLRNLE